MAKKQLHFSVGDLTKSAMQRIIEQLVMADDGEEEKVLAQLAQNADKERNDLADLVEEKRGKPAEIDPEEEEMQPKKRGMA